MRTRSSFQKLIGELKDSKMCHLSSDDEWPTRILRKEEIHHPKQNSDDKNENNTPEDPNYGSRCRFLDDEEIHSILKRNLNTTYIKKYIDTVLSSNTSESLLRTLPIRHSSMTRYEIKDLVSTDVMNRLLVEEKKWVIATILRLN